MKVFRDFPKRYGMLLLIVSVAIILRFYQLGSNPPSLDWDEASLGYNAYSLLQTGKDEYGSSWPLSIRSFGDHKPPLYTYVTIPIVALFGLTEFAVRLPSAIFGVIAVLTTYFLVAEFLYKEKEEKRSHVALIASFLLAISPWHLQFSRVAFEANIGLTLFILGVWLFLKGLRKGIFLSLSAIAFALSLYAYHSPRLVAPVFLFGLALWFRKSLWRQKKATIIAGVIGLLLTAPLVYVFSQGGQARFSSVTIFTNESLKNSIPFLESAINRKDYLGMVFFNRRAIYAIGALKGYIDHFDLNFLFFTGDGPARHHAVDMGMLYLASAPFIAYGVYMLVRKKEGWSYPLFWWFLTAPLASSITSGTPHAVRALLYLPVYQIFTAYGLYQFFTWLKSYAKQKSVFFAQKYIKIVILAVFALNIVYYLNLYYIHTPIEHSLDWQYGYKQAVAEIDKYKDEVDRIVFTFSYDQPYIYPLFYKPVDPAWYQGNWGEGEVKRDMRQFGKYEFRAINWENDKKLSNALLVGTPAEIPADAPGHIVDIPFLNGEIAFRIVRL